VKVTKYPQSCLIIEQQGKRIVIDPGALVSDKFKAQDLLPLDAILITHEHEDHADPELIRELVGDGSTPVIANQSTKNLLGELVTQVVSDYEEFETAGIKVIARELPHCLMVDGSAGPQNTGYVVDGVFFHAGDGITLDNLQVQTAAIPIAGPDISARDVFDFIKQLRCTTVIPIHYDYFLENPKLLAGIGEGEVPDVKFVVLDSGQSAEL
jgi:L-ascorbate metabolism protein UlaG (beta-lactamase superfamily)